MVLICPFCILLIILCKELEGMMFLYLPFLYMGDILKGRANGNGRYNLGKKHGEEWREVLLSLFFPHPLCCTQLLSPW